MKTYRIDVYGRVQGVFFRRGVKKYAGSRDLVGNVENQSDGSVLINVQCSPGKLRAFLKWLESSPGASKVERAELEIIDAKKFDSFEILRNKDSFLGDKKEAFLNLVRRS